ncbi:MAG: hypothetical protein ACLRSY_02785 [Acutalibacter sp.]
MTVLPEHYQPALGLYETQKAIGLIKNIFQVKLCAALHKRHRACSWTRPPASTTPQRRGAPVSFDIPAVGIEGQVVPLAKWKRLALRLQLLWATAWWRI